jgi:hypothetical protein
VLAQELKIRDFFRGGGVFLRFLLLLGFFPLVLSLVGKLQIYSPLPLGKFLKTPMIDD